MENASAPIMNLAPWQQIVRQSCSEPDYRDRETAGFRGDSDDMPHAQSVPSFLRTNFPNGADGDSRTLAQHQPHSVQDDGELERCNRMASSETQTPVYERPAAWRLLRPNWLRIGEPCATNDPEYLEIFGPKGSVEQCKEQFIGSRFSPRKALRMTGAIESQRDLGKQPVESTDVCVVALCRTAHAA